MCILEEGDCPEACKDVVKKTEKETEKTEKETEKKSGKITVTNEENEGAVVISQGYETELDRVIISTDEEITLNSMTFDRYGLSTANSIDQIWLENEDGEKVTTEKSLSSSKDAVTLNIKKDYKELSKGKHTFVVVVKTAECTNNGTLQNDGTCKATTEDGKSEKATSNTLGSNVGFTISSITSSAASEKINVSAKAYLYNFGDYSGDGAVEVSYKGSSRTYSYEEGKYYEVASIKVKANTAAINVDGFTLTNKSNNAIDLDKISDLDVVVDGVSLKNVKFSNSSRDELKISFATQEVAIKKSTTFVVKVKIADFDKNGETLKFVIESSSDVAAKEVKTNVRTHISLPTDADRNDDNKDWIEYTFNGSKVTLTNTKLGKVEAAAGSSDVVVAKGTIALNGQPITINEISITPKVSNANVEGHDVAEIVESIKLLLNGDEIAEFTKKNSWKQSRIDIDEDGTLEVVVDLDEDTTVKVGGEEKLVFENATISVIEGTLDLSNIKWQDVKFGTEGDKVSIIGMISIENLKVTASKNTLTNDLTKSVEFKANQGNDSKVVFSGTLTAKKSDLRLTDVIMKKITDESNFFSTDSKNSISFDVKVGNDTVATLGFDKSTKNNTERETVDDLVIKQGETVSVIVKANVNATKEIKDLQFSLAFEAKDGKNNDAEVKAEQLAKIDIVTSNKIEVSNSVVVKKDDVILTNGDRTIGGFYVNPKKGSSSATIDTMDITTTNVVFKDETIDTSDEVEDYYKILIGGEDIADKCDFGSTTTTITCENVDVDINGKTEVIIKARKDLEKTAEDANIQVTTVINKAADEGKTSIINTRQVVNAFVRITKQTVANNVVSYTYAVETDDNQTVSHLQLCKGTACKTIEAGDLNSNGGVKKFNISDSSKITDVDTIKYVVDGKTLVTITNMADFLKTDDDVQLSYYGDADAATSTTDDTTGD